MSSDIMFETRPSDLRCRVVGSFLCSLPRPRLRQQPGRRRTAGRSQHRAVSCATRQRPARRHHVLFRLLGSREMRGDLRRGARGRLSRTHAFRAHACAARARHPGYATRGLRRHSPCAALAASQSCSPAEGERERAGKRTGGTAVTGQQSAGAGTVAERRRLHAQRAGTEQDARAIAERPSDLPHVCAFSCHPPPLPVFEP